MAYKFVFLIVVFYFLAVFQGSFLPHFSVFGTTPNFLLILVCVLALIEGSGQYYGIVSALSAGFFLDFLGGAFFGSYIVGMLLVYYFIKKALVFLVDFPNDYYALYFLPVLALSSIIFRVSAWFMSFVLSPLSAMRLSPGVFLAEVILNMLVGIVIFWALRKLKPNNYGF